MPRLFVPFFCCFSPFIGVYVQCLDKAGVAMCRVKDAILKNLPSGFSLAMTGIDLNPDEPGDGWLLICSCLDHDAARSLPQN